MTGWKRRPSPAHATPRSRVRQHAVRLPSVDSSADLPVDADPPERRRDARPVAEALRRIMKRYRLQDSSLLDEVKRVWPELAGPAFSDKLVPGKYDRNILYLYARNSLDLFEIRRFGLRQLEQSVKRHKGFEAIRQVRLQLNPEGGGLSER